MLVQYTHISQLTTEQQQRLKTFIGGRILEGQAYVQFEGLTLSVSEVRARQKTWEAESRQNTRQILRG